MKTLRDIGENAAIARLARLLPATGTDVVAGIGDDCAVVRLKKNTGYDLLLTSDPVIEGVHFEASAKPAGIGHKAVGRVLSDIAAMGGEPLWALVDVVAPAATPVRRLTGIYRGLGRLSAQAGLTVIGGDMAAGPALELHVFAVGQAPSGTALRRSGARPGDMLFVTGALGGSIRGKHLTFTPRLQEGAWLRRGRWATAMMDVSDGLAADLPRLALASRCSAELDLAAIPVSRAARRMRDGLTAAEHALRDGEDFELLFTVPPRRAAAFTRAWHAAGVLPCTAIGRLVAGPAGRVECRAARGRGVELPRGGFDHYRRHD
jgi:thiamine-monophosphate kinase